MFGGEKVGTGIVNVNCFFLVLKGIVSLLFQQVQNLCCLDVSEDDSGRIRITHLYTGRVDSTGQPCAHVIRVSVLLSHIFVQLGRSAIGSLHSPIKL